jgi:hypothetical protein
VEHNATFYAIIAIAWHPHKLSFRILSRGDNMTIVYVPRAAGCESVDNQGP